MAPIDGAIGMKININHPQTTDVNIFKAQPSKASGLGGVVFLRSKSAPTLYKYRFLAKHARPVSLIHGVTAKTFKRYRNTLLGVPRLCLLDEFCLEQLAACLKHV